MRELTDTQQISHNSSDDTQSTTYREFLGFLIGEELYGINICDIEEIRVWQTPTLIPNSADFVMGVINLRGMIVPIFDLRIRFHRIRPDYQPTTVIIVLKGTNSQGDTKHVGVVVDGVADVITCMAHEITPLQRVTSLSRFIEGITRQKNGLATILSTRPLMDLTEESEEGFCDQ
ncbi:chemotaxis protein CheW [Vibrio proteolyticus]|uniref:Chemotaxis protein CheW n=1 Tax=Vibrio proteolyticus NBRC 13287 TaxID=1219065 RepID=U3B693_VIBPR|nr:chemotaxis protein CheW [Vibrio proteolyticus]GAD65359.1 chemotaxis protein CheW [Vibrio proteolyticus NBRC 13287]